MRWVSSFDDGKVLVVLDGQLHNVPRVSQSSVEILHARFCEMGTRYAEGLLGDFVIIALDRTRDCLTVSRDPLGVRPWYQARAGQGHFGATDVATLCGLPGVDDSVNEEVALAFLAGVTQSRGPTFHRGITSLPPGVTWISDPRGCRSWQHHQWQFVPESNVTWDEAVERCRATLDLAVGSRIEAAGAATSELSGGLDSSAVVGTAALGGRSDIVVGRLLFDGEYADERAYSAEVIAHWGLRDVSVRPWLMNDAEAAHLTATLRRPIPDPNYTMFHSLHAALLAEGRASAMTGLGGDDAFVARSHRTRVISAAQLRRHDILRAVLMADMRSPLSGWRRTIRPLFGALSGRARRRPPSYIAATAAKTLGLADQLARGPQPVTGVLAIDERAAGITSGYLAHALETAAVVADLTGWRSSHPFLDPHFIGATWGLDPWFAVRGGHDRALELGAFAERLPPTVASRRTKAEFSEVAWAGLPPATELHRRLMTGPLADRGWVDREHFARMLAGANERQRWTALPVSRAVALDRWLRS
jgi:asparagine synthase (glutamine-hydrolysing)